MRHTGGLLRRAVSMVVQLENYGLEARLWIASGWPTTRLATNRDLGAVACHTLGYDTEGEKFLSQLPERNV
jgi:hypothetical protein